MESIDSLDEKMPPFPAMEWNPPTPSTGTNTALAGLCFSFGVITLLVGPPDSDL